MNNDYPVTVKSAHSVSEVILAPKEIGHTGITKPEVMLLLFKEGLSVVRSQLAAMTEDDFLIINSELLLNQTMAKMIPIDFKQVGHWANKKEYWAMIALSRILHVMQIYPLEALKEAIYALTEFTEENLAAIEAGETLNLDISDSLQTST